MRKILLLPLLLLNCLILNAQVCTKSQLPANLQNGLVAFYPFCGNVNDSSGNGRNGQLNGQSIFIADRFGITQSAVSLQDVNDKMESEVESN